MKIKTPQQVMQARQAGVLEKAGELAARITAQLEGAPGLSTSSTQYLTLDTNLAAEEQEAVLRRAEDLLGHQGWLDVRIGLSRQAPPQLKVSLVVPANTRQGGQW